MLGTELEADLVEMMYRNRNRHLSGEPGMIVPTLWISLGLY